MSSRSIFLAAGRRIPNPGCTCGTAASRRPSSIQAEQADLEALDQLAGAADVILIGTTGEAVSYDDLRRRGLRPGRAGLLDRDAALPAGRDPVGRRPRVGRPAVRLARARLEPGLLRRRAGGLRLPAGPAHAGNLGRDRGRGLADRTAVGPDAGGPGRGGRGARAPLVSPGGFAAGRDEPHLHRPNGPGGTLPNYRCYRCADGRWLFFGAFHDRVHRTRGGARSTWSAG